MYSSLILFLFAFLMCKFGVLSEFTPSGAECPRSKQELQNGVQPSELSVSLALYVTAFLNLSYFLLHCYFFFIGCPDFSPFPYPPLAWIYHAITLQGPSLPTTAFPATRRRCWLILLTQCACTIPDPYHSGSTPTILNFVDSSLQLMAVWGRLRDQIAGHSRLYSLREKFGPLHQYGQDSVFSKSGWPPWGAWKYRKFQKHLVFTVEMKWRHGNGFVCCQEADLSGASGLLHRDWMHANRSHMCQELICELYAPTVLLAGSVLTIDWALIFWVHSPAKIIHG